MALEIQYLDWDSNFFRLRCGRLLGENLQRDSLQQALQQAQSDQIECLYYLANPAAATSLRMLEKFGFHLVDVRLTFRIQFVSNAETGPSQPDPINELQEADEGHIPQLRRIALASYEKTRFLNDPGFDRQRARELYAVWIANSVRGFADKVFTVQSGREVLGFISLHLPAETRQGSIGLVGVAEAARGQGIGLHLVQAALAWFVKHGAASVQVVTQASNQAAQRLYQRAGFQLASTGLWYHKWFQEDC